MEMHLSPQLEEVLTRAEDLLTQQNPVEAAQVLTEAQPLATSPHERSALWTLLGHTLTALGQYDQAEHYLRDAIKESFYDSLNALFDLHSLYQTTQQPWQALATSLEIVQLTQEQAPVLATQLEITGALYADLGFPGYATPHYRRALRELRALGADPHVISDLPRRLRAAERVPPRQWAREGYSIQLVAELRNTVHGQDEFRQCMDNLSDLHLAKENQWMSLLCSIEVLASNPEAQLWQKHQRRAAELWAVHGDVELSLLHYRELVYVAAQERDVESVRSLTLAILEALQPNGWSEDDLTNALQRLPDGPAGEFLLDLLYNLYRKGQ